MSFTNKRYNIAIVFLIIMIVSIIAFSAVAMADSLNDGGLSGGNVDAQNPEPGNGEELEDNTDVPRAPTFFNAFDAYDYANNILTNGKGYKSIQKQTVQTNMFGVIQHVDVKNFKNSKAAVAYIETTTTGAPLGMNHLGSNMNTILLRQGNEVLVRKTPNNRKEFKPSDLAIAYSISEFRTKNGVNVGESTLNISRKGATVTSFSLNKGVYTLSFRLNSNAWQNYIRSMEFNGAENVTVSSIEVTFKIDAKTGFFINMERVDKYGATMDGMRANNCVATVKETFSNMNRDIEFALPEMPQ